MKATLLIGFALASSLTTLAQGKVNLINDSASLIVLTTTTWALKPADLGLAGQAVGNLSPLPSGVTLEAGLYGGTSSSSLFLYSVVPLNNASTPGGYIPATHIALNANAATGAPNIPGIANNTAIGASTPWFQVRVWDSAYSSYAAALAASSYVSLPVGATALFQFNPGPSLSYPNTAPASGNSTWTDGNIVIFAGPEPSAIALVGLGAATLAMFRRRK